MDEIKTKIFISYSHHDRAICDTIAATLEKVGSFSLWYDKGLIPGEEYRKRIAEVIRKSDAFIVLISGKSVCSDWVLDEVEYAKKLQKKILPIWIEDTRLPDNLDMILQRYHSLFWHMRASDSQFTDALCAALLQKNKTGKDKSGQISGNSAVRKAGHSGAGGKSGNGQTKVAPAELLLDDAFSHSEELAAALADFRQGRFDLAFQALARLAEKNDAKAQLMLARMYAYGLGTQQNTDRADFWYASAAKLEDAEAQYAYGAVLTDRCDAQKQQEKANWDKGIALLKSAADHDYKAAMEKYIAESSGKFGSFANFRYAIGYCDRLIEKSDGAYEKKKYAKAKEELRKRQVKAVGDIIATGVTAACDTVGALVCLAGALYLLAGILPQLRETSALLGKLPIVAEENLLPVKEYWNWIFTFMDVSGAFGLELILLGAAIRGTVKNQKILKFSGIVGKIAGAAYAGIFLWYIKAYSDIGNVVSDSNLEKLVYVMAAVLVSTFLGYILGAILSLIISAVFPNKRST